MWAASGSERADTSSSASQQALAEARHINTSLTVLGRVIIALTRAARSGGHTHVPYRDSRLTFLLEVSNPQRSHFQQSERL